VGGWWEITQPHVEAAGLKWRGRYPWDWHADVGFATGYTPEERRKLVDVYMEKFKEVFGKYPTAIGSWFIDAYTLGYMYDKYGIVASCNCKDQIGTDGYTLWGGYWNQAYYPSRVNAYMPAQTREGQIPVPVFRMLGSDPIYQYDNCVGGALQGVISLEPVYGDSGGRRRFAYNTTMNTNAGGFTFGDLGQTNLPGYSTGEYGNPDVAWEEATKADVGIELGLFNKIKIQADYFYEKREGIFIQRESTPSVVGTKTAQWVNLGRMKNQGFDMSLEFDHSFNKDFSISARGNFTYNRNKKLYDDKPDQIWKYQNLAGFANNQQFGLIAEGLFESEEDIANWPKQDFGTVRPGDIKYRDVNGDGVVNTFDKVAIGYTLVPEINYGFGASLKWKGIDVSVFFSGVGHVTRIIQGQNLFGASSTILRMGQIFEDVAKNRWTLDNQNPNAPYPRLSLNKVDNNQQLSTYWQRDMSFLRLKDAEIGYTLPESMTKKWGLSKIRFYIQGKNLVTFSDFKLWDPEVNANYGNVYPLIRTFAIGANVNF